MSKYVERIVDKMILKKELIKNIKRMRERLCAYKGNICDCKYIKDSSKHICSMSEDGSGCPELRTVIYLLSNLKNEDYLNLMKNPENLKRRNESVPLLRSLAGKKCCFECETCSARPGRPILCESCLKQRDICQNDHSK